MSGVASLATGPRAGRAERVWTAAQIARLWQGVVRWMLLSSVVALTAPSAIAQVADTTAADTAIEAGEATDSADVDTTAAAAGADAMAGWMDGAVQPGVDRPAVGFEAIWSGRALTDSLPTVLPALDLVELIGRAPGSFTYWFGTAGWPDGWSFRGLPPHLSTLSLNDRPFNHLFTGRPAHQLVPIAFIERPELRQIQFGRPAAIITRMRPFAESTPVTEGKYWRGGDGLQSIAVVHAQHRRRPLFGNPGFLNVLGAYSGRAADGEYPDSRLRRARQVMLRVRYEQIDWSLELLNLHNRRNVGAHGGVMPLGDFETIYIRPGARVENPGAWRRTVRNDLMATARTRLIGRPSTLSLFWTAETYRYRAPLDTLGTSSDRFGVQVAQPLVHTDRHSLSVAAAAWHDGVSPRHQFAHPEVSRSRYHASVRDTLRGGAWQAALDGGVAGGGGAVRPVGAAGLSGRIGAVGVELSAAVTERAPDVVMTTGFGSLYGFGRSRPIDESGAAAPPSDRTMHASSAVSAAAGVFDVTLGGFASRRPEPTDYFAVGDDSVEVLTPGSPLDVIGGYATAGWRRNAARGIYATAQATLHAFQETGDPLIQRIADSLPAASGGARLGARFVLFQGDLDVNAYVEGFAWSAMRSRTLHPQTGLLVVREAGARLVDPSSILNAGAEAGVRGATLFLVYENALSGTALLTGNMIVPVYPLPARRFRFGVFWPIFG